MRNTNTCLHCMFVSRKIKEIKKLKNKGRGLPFGFDDLKVGSFPSSPRINRKYGLFEN